MTLSLPPSRQRWPPAGHLRPPPPSYTFTPIRVDHYSPEEVLRWPSAPDDDNQVFAEAAHLAKGGLPLQGGRSASSVRERTPLAQPRTPPVPPCLRRACGPPAPPQPRSHCGAPAPAPAPFPRAPGAAAPRPDPPQPPARARALPARPRRGRPSAGPAPAAPARPHEGRASRPLRRFLRLRPSPRLRVRTGGAGPCACAEPAVRRGGRRWGQAVAVGTAGPSLRRCAAPRDPRRGAADSPASLPPARRSPARGGAAPKMSQTAMSETYDFLFKFLVIGNAGTGKSCLLHQFIEKKFKDDSNHTIGVEFGSKIINVGGKYVKLQIWDTAGQERFRSVTRSYYRGAAGALLVYDITSRETYNALTNWLTDARMLASQNIVIILCGNKKDLDTDREVTFLEASRFAQENELMFLETSALTGENVEEAFVQCARKILNKIESGELDPERMGSGIQYGDAALRQLRSPRRAQAPSAQECGC
ncbi:ras-related protein Rab-4A [Moschus berezovskii]|uniref:ras-related protein Rab-4A n=1 Tax=Moschus berezovskii TaxID=68408 RepID=UPI002443CB22|nr:ras-related protein Rab-4A [Moschus berezovskii]